MAGFPSFALGFLLATVIYTGALTVPNVITAMTGTVKFRIYGSSLEVYHEISMKGNRGNQLVLDSFYSINDPTVIYFHGFTETPNSLSVLTVVRALLALRPRVNVVVVDWSKIASNEFYPIPALMTTVLGRRVARQIDRWIRSGHMAIGGLRLVGHSLGAQCAGFTAKAIRKGRVPFLIGLDPAYPGFFFPSAVKLHISRFDADTVSIIHTDGGVYGVPYNTGWIDFYPNGGTRFQPGCPANTTLLSDADFCSHWRAWQIFSESISGGNFIAVRCDRYEDFLDGHCKDNLKFRVDFFHTTSHKVPKGSYFFRTASEEPYALGPEGAEPPDFMHDGGSEEEEEDDDDEEQEMNKQKSRDYETYVERLTVINM